MLYRKIPKNGDALSILGFGLMRLPVTQEGKIDEPRAIRQIRDAIDRGVTYLDTAWPYHAGESENVLGRAMAGGYRDTSRVAGSDVTMMMDILLTNQQEVDKAQWCVTEENTR